MINEKEISIDLFTAQEKAEIERRVAAASGLKNVILSAKASKALVKKIKREVMHERLQRQASAKAKPVRSRKPAVQRESEVQDFSWQASRREPPRR